MGRNNEYDGVRIASSSSIEIDFYYAGKRWRERVKCQPTDTNLKKMEVFRMEILTAIEKGTFDYTVTFPNSKNAALFAPLPELVTMPLGEYLSTWVEKKKEDLHSSSYAGYKRAIEGVLKPKLGHIDIKRLTQKDVREAMKSIDRTNKWLSNLQSVLRVALDEAVEDEILEVNPSKHYTFKHKKPAKSKRHKINPFNREEQIKLLDAARGQFKNLCQFAMWTGLRPSEYIALLWEDINWDAKTVNVNKAQTTDADDPEDPKTECSIRDVKLLPMALAALEAQKEFTFHKGGVIFENPATGLPWLGDRSIRQNHWKWTLKRAGIAYRPPYQMRHTYASMMVSAGENPQWVASQMGHEDWGLIRIRYAKWMPDADPNAGSTASEIFGQRRWNDGGNVDQNVDQPSQKQTKIDQSEDQDNL